MDLDPFGGDEEFYFVWDYFPGLCCPTPSTKYVHR